MTNQPLARRIDGVRATQRLVWIDVLPAGGRAAGATARFRLEFTTTGDVKKSVAVRGRLFLTPGPDGWKVFGYDVAKGTPEELQPPQPKKEPKKLRRSAVEEEPRQERREGRRSMSTARTTRGPRHFTLRLISLRLLPLALVLAVAALVVPDSAVKPTDVALVKVNRASGVDVSPDVVWILAVGSDARPGAGHDPHPGRRAAADRHEHEDRRRGGDRRTP